MMIWLSVSGWFAAALALGLYLGERGRRMDAQRREGRVPVGRVKRAKVTEAAALVPPASVPAAVATDLSDAKESYIEACMRDGHTREEAEADWTEMLATAGAIQV